MIEIATTSGSKAVIDEADLDELRMRMRGPLLRVGQAGYGTFAHGIKNQWPRRTLAPLYNYLNCCRRRIGSDALRTRKEARRCWAS